MISSRERNGKELYCFQQKERGNAICCLLQSFALFERVGRDADDESCRLTLWGILYSFIWTWDVPHKAVT